MIWTLSHRFDPASAAIADRHYNRQKPGTPQFVPPGRCVVLNAPHALWVTSWPFAEYTKHEWAGAWVCSAFRREPGATLPASEMIRQAVAVTRWTYGDAPALGMVTFVDERKVRPTKVRGVDVWGWTYLRAGFEACGRTKGGLLALRLPLERMPSPEPPVGAGLRLW